MIFDTYYLPDSASDTTCMGNAAVLGRRMTMIRNSSDIAYLQEGPYRWGAAIYRPTPVPPSASPVPELYYYFHDTVNAGRLHVGQHHVQRRIGLPRVARSRCQQRRCRCHLVPM